ncbi:MAG TPA: 3'-5' exonuclease [Marinobacter sp.]|nr:3'-5' exonuclease [Marinobacter sp.]
MLVLDQLKHWIGKQHGVQIGDHNLDRLPVPKVPGDQLLSESRLIVLDLETTGLNPFKHDVIAIGAVAITNGVICMSDQFDLILRRPELDVSKTVLIHGIGPEALTQGHETEDALLHLLEWMNGDPILAFHSAFDQRFLEKTLRKELGYKANHIWMDVADFLPATFPDTKAHGKSLDDWTDSFGLEVSARHHAAADAMVTAELTLIALNKAQKDNVITLRQLLNKLAYYRRLRNLARG